MENFAERPFFPTYNHSLLHFLRNFAVEDKPYKFHLPTIKKMNYWLMKTEPDCFSWDDMKKAGKATWDGVRNYAARNNMQAMKKGDLVFIYHSNIGKEIVGIAEVTKEAYPDPTTDDARWVVVDVKPKKSLKKPVTLAEIKTDDLLKNMLLVRQGRLSVTALTKEEFDHILMLSQNN